MKFARGSSFALGAALLFAPGCDNAFRSRALPSLDDGTAFSFQFPGGGSEASLRKDGVLELDLAVPQKDHHSFSDSGAILEPSLLVIRSTPDLSPGVDPNLFPLLLDAGLVEVAEEQDGALPIHVSLPLTGGPVDVPVGFTVLEAFVIDDFGRSSEPVSLELTVRAFGRATVVVRFEQPALGGLLSEVLLPTDEDGAYFVGDERPYALVVRATPDEDTGASFGKLWNGADFDSTRLHVTADRELGTGGAEVYAAGDDLSPLFAREIDPAIDPDTGELVIAATFALGDPLVPDPGPTHFTVTVLDDEDVDSEPGSGDLLTVIAVLLSADVQPILDKSCAKSFCHGSTFPALDLDLSTPEKTFSNMVLVRAEETPDNSCAIHRIQPYDPFASYCVHKLLNTHRDGCVDGSGDIMPAGGPPLADRKIEIILNWVLQGAHPD